ncbi:MAG: hypothetical protein ABI947_03835 [Chloroflexota bacterium]
MKIVRIGLLLVVLGMFVSGVSAAQAAPSSLTVVVTQAQVNAALSTVSTTTKGIANASVVIQPTGVVLTASVTVPGKTPVVTVSVWTFAVTSSGVTTTLKSVTVNGKPATQDTINKLNSYAATLRSAFIKAAQTAGKTPPTYKITNIVLEPGYALVTLTTR